METPEVPSSSGNTDTPSSPHLGQLGRLPGEVRSLIYEYVLPPEDDRAFRAKRRFLPGKPPGLLFASTQIRQETIMFYFGRTKWLLLVKHNSAKSQQMPDGYFLASQEPDAITLGRFLYRDAFSSMELDEQTPLFQQVSLERVSGSWPRLVIKIVKGRPVIRHGDCLACGVNTVVSRAMYDGWFSPYRHGPQSRRLLPLTATLEDRHQEAIDVHNKGIARIEKALFKKDEVSSFGFSVENMRDIVARITRDVSRALSEQSDLLRDFRSRSLWPEGHPMSDETHRLGGG